MTLPLLLAAPSPLDAIRTGGLQMTLPERLTGLIGIVVILAIAWLVSYDRKRIPWRLVATGLALQAAFGVLVLKTAPGRWFFEAVGGVDHTGCSASPHEGARFVFGNLCRANVPVGMPRPGGGSTPRPASWRTPAPSSPSSPADDHLLLRADVGALLPRRDAVVVKGARLGDAEDAAARRAPRRSRRRGNIFLGQTEAPLLIKPFVDTMTQSELMHGDGRRLRDGRRRRAGGLRRHALGHVPEHRGHLLAASVMNAPAGLLLLAKMMPCPRPSDRRAGDSPANVERRSQKAGRRT